MSFKLLRKRGPVSKKAQVEVITVMLILGITVAAVFVAYQFAAPQIEKSKDVSRIASMQKLFLEFNNKIREVRFEGEGAQRYIDINFDKGDIRVNPNDDTIWFFMPAPGIESAPQETNMETYFSGRTINIKLQYGGEIELLSSFSLLQAGNYRVYIQNKGGNDILLGLTPDIPVTGETWILEGFVYDNTEGGNNNGTNDETVPTMDNNLNSKIFDAVDDVSLAGAEVIFINQKQEIVAVTTTNSQGKFAVKLPQSVGVNDLELYMQVYINSYVMKENDGASTVYTKTNLYHKDFNRNLGTWKVNINPSLGKNTNEFKSSSSYIDGYFLIPMYKLTKQDIFETVPIAIVMLDTPGNELNINDTDYDNLLFDVMDAFDNTAGSAYHCKYFVVFGSVDAPQGISKGGGAWIQYPDTAETIYVYPLEWLLDPNAGKGPIAGEYGTYTMFSDIASIDGVSNVLNYKDFSLVLVASGSANDTVLLEKLHTYKPDLTNFLSQDRLIFKGVNFSRGLVVFSQFSDVTTVDPDDLTVFYPNETGDSDSPVVSNINIIPDGRRGYNPSEFPHPPVYINSTNGGYMAIAANVRDESEIIAVTAIIKNNAGTKLGGLNLLDNGLDYDRVSGDGTFSGVWTVPNTLVTADDYRLEVQAIDEFGNINTRSTYIRPDNWNPRNFLFSVTVDNNPPTNSSALNSNLGYVTTSPYTFLSSTVQDPLSGVSRILYQTFRLPVSGNPIQTDPHNYYAFIPLSEGGFNYSVTTYDRAQNIREQKVVVLRDTTQPSVTDYMPQDTILINNPIITVNYIDNGVGISSADLYYDQALVNSQGPGSSMLQSLAVAAPDGTHTGNARISDKLGNINWHNWTFNVNYEGPSITVTNPSDFLTFTNAGNINITGTSAATGGVSVNGGAFSTPNFNQNVGLVAGPNIIKIEADGIPTTGAGSANNTVLTRVVVQDSNIPIIPIINSPTAVTPRVARAGGRAYIDFNYSEQNPSYCKIKVYKGLTVIGETTTTLNTVGTSYVIGSGNHRIVGVSDILNNAVNGLYDVNVTMVDLAGGVNSLVVANAVRIDNDGPQFSITPGYNAWGDPTDAIVVSITDVNAGIFRDSIRMFILGESNTSGSVINVEVTPNLNYSSIANGYQIRYKPSWPFEDMEKVNVTVQAADKAGNTQSLSSFYWIYTLSPDIDDLDISTYRAEEGETVKVEFDVKQCIPPPTHESNESILSVTVTVGNLGKIIYEPDGNGYPTKARLVRSASSTLPGGPAFLDVTYNGTPGGVCTGMNLFKYSFTGNNGITFTVPDYAGDLYNPIKVTATNYGSWVRTNTQDLYIMSVKHRDTVLDKTYGKYSWLPSFAGTDMSIGRVSNDPVGDRYQIYGQLHDTNRRLTVYDIRTDTGVINVYTQDTDGDRILWDRGRVPVEFSAPNNVIIDLADRINNVEKVSIENSIMNTLPNEFAISVHGQFDLTDTLWTSNNIMLIEKDFTKIDSRAGTRINYVPAVSGGPVLMIRERRDSFNNILSNIVITTMDIDRYKNNRQADGQDMHAGDTYNDFARNLEENLIVWACGQEILIG